MCRNLPAENSFRRSHNTPDEQWEHYTDIEKKCKRLSGIAEAVPRTLGATFILPHKNNIKPLKKVAIKVKARIKRWGLLTRTNQMLVSKKNKQREGFSVYMIRIAEAMS